MSFVVCRREAASRCLTVRLQLPPPASTPRTGASRDHGLGSAQASPVKDTNRPDLFPSTRITPYNPRRAPILHSLYLFTPYLTRCPGFSASFSRSHLPGLTRPRRASGSPGTRCHIWTHHPRFSSLLHVLVSFFCRVPAVLCHDAFSIIGRCHETQPSPAHPGPHDHRTPSRCPRTCPSKLHL